MSNVSLSDAPSTSQALILHGLDAEGNVAMRDGEVGVPSSVAPLTRPFLGLGRPRATAASVLSGGIRRRTRTSPIRSQLEPPRAGPSSTIRRRPAPTVEDIHETISQVISAANITANRIGTEQGRLAQALEQSHQAAQSGIEQTQTTTQEALTTVVLTAAQQRELDSASIAGLREQDAQTTANLIRQSFQSLNERMDAERIQQAINNQDIRNAFIHLEERMASIERRSRDRSIDDWRSRVREPEVGLRGGIRPTSLPEARPAPFPSLSQYPHPVLEPVRGRQPQWVPRPSPNRYEPTPTPEPQTPILEPQAVVPAEGDITKFKPTITFGGTENLESFTFALNQAIKKYRLTSDGSKLIALGDSLRGDALGWWSHQRYDNYIAAIAGLEDQFKDLGRHGDYLRKLNRLTQTSTTCEFFKEAERLNLYAQLLESALWLTLKQGLSTPLRAALVSYYPPPNSYSQWKSAALKLRAELDSIHSTRPTKTPMTKKTTQRPREDSKEEGFKRSCYNCGKEGHSAARCRSKTKDPGSKEKDKGKGKEKDPKEIRITTTDSRKRRRQGEDHYPSSKRQDVGTVRITELVSDNEEEPINDPDSSSDSDSDHDSGKD